MITRLFFKKLPSTNQYVKDNYQKLHHFTAVSALCQTNGRGRLGRRWFSNDDATFSILLKENISQNDMTKISLVASSSVYCVLKKYGMFNIKWPNDIIYHNKKVAGILTEAIISDKVECIIVGIGVNCNEEIFDESIKDKAISLKQITGKEIVVKDLIREITLEFEKEYLNFINGSDDCIKVAKEASNIIGKTIKATINRKTVEAKAIDILDNGNLLVFANGEERELFSGEVTLEQNY